MVMRRLQKYVPGLLGMYSTACQTRINLVSSFVISLVIVFSHLYFLSSTYQRKAYRVYHPSPQFIAYTFYCTRLPPSVTYHSLFLLSVAMVQDQRTGWACRLCNTLGLSRPKPGAAMRNQLCAKGVPDNAHCVN